MADRRLTPAAQAALEKLLNELGSEVGDLTVAQAQLAREAHRRYGPGSGSKARLNLAAADERKREERASKEAARYPADDSCLRTRAPHSA